MNFSRSFDLNRGSGILSDDSAGTITASSAGADLVRALRDNAAFPPGDFNAGSVKLDVAGGSDVAFLTAGTQVRFGASAQAGIGVFNEPSAALAELGMGESVGLNLAPAAEHRYLLFRWGYSLSGSPSVRHPLGALTLSAAADIRRDGLFAILRRFPAQQGARDAIGGTVGNWRLPSQVSDPSQLEPGTWLLAETEGRLAVNLAAQAGYDFTFVRELRSAGLSGDVGLRLDAVARATFGFEVAGRYVVALGRDDDSQKLRLRIYKLRRNGVSFGLNLSAGLKALTPPVPDTVDEFVEAVFGVHGQQVIKDLHAIEQWTDPDKDLSDTVAGLVNRTGLDLLKRATGIDSFDAARDRMVQHLRLWDRLPENVQAASWKVLGDERFRSAVNALADPEPKQRSRALGAMIADAARAPWLDGIAGRGVLELMNRVDEIHEYAVVLQEILNGRVISGVQAFIAERLNLQGLRAATSFEQVDGWLVQRLSQFLDERIDQKPIEDVRTLINTVVGKRHEIYTAARRALAQRYSASLAATYARTTSRTALVDAEFDMAAPEARTLFAKVLHNGDYDTLLTDPTAGVRLREGVLTHGIEKQTSVQLTLPRVAHSRGHIQRMLASVKASDEGGRILLYDLSAEDVAAVRNRLRSELAVTAAFPRSADGNLRVRSRESFSWSYRMITVRSSMSAADLQARVAPFLAKYLAEATLQLPAEGDTIIDMQVSVPGTALAVWFRDHSADEIREMTKRIRQTLRRLLPFYFRDDGRNPANGALRTWAVMHVPPDADYMNVTVRRQLVAAPLTLAHLKAAHEDDARSFQQLAVTPQGDALLTHLLTFESRVVNAATAALRRTATDRPSDAVERLAEMGEDITNAFHGRLSSVYGGDALRVLGSAVFLEATCALDPALREARPDALLRVFVLQKPPRNYELSDYLKGIDPPNEAILAAETLATTADRTSLPQPPAATAAAAVPGSAQSRGTPGV